MKYKLEEMIADIVKLGGTITGKTEGKNFIYTISSKRYSASGIKLDEVCELFLTYSKSRKQ